VIILAPGHNCLQGIGITLRHYIHCKSSDLPDVESKSLLEHAVREVHNLRLLQHLPSNLLEFSVCEIFVDIVIPVFRTLELNNESVRYAALPFNQHNLPLIHIELAETA
jgi:hypothetical protein